jgi:hypothetical protein
MILTLGAWWKCGEVIIVHNKKAHNSKMLMKKI